MQVLEHHNLGNRVEGESTVDTRLLADSRISRDPEVEAQKLVKSL